MTARGRDPSGLLDQYEALRREATEAAPGGPRGHGLALFLTRGMSVWLEALTALAPRARPPASTLAAALPEQGPAVPIGVRAELTTVLASMVLACTPEEAIG